MSHPLDNFPGIQAAIQEGIDRRLHTGVQIYVSVAGETVLDTGFGRANRDHDFTSETIVLWRSAGKPVTAAAILRLIEQGRFSLDLALEEFLPEVQGAPSATVTIEQLLTHSSGLPLMETGWPESSWSDTIQTICSEVNLTAGSAYQPQSTWFLLGEVLQRFDEAGRTFQQILTEDILMSVGMENVWCGLPESAVSKFSSVLPDYFVRERGELVASPYSQNLWLTRPSPGGNLRGPVRNLGRFYEMLLNRGKLSDGSPFLAEQSVQQMTLRHRTGMFDETLQHIVDFGLGVIVDSNSYGADTVPYGFGRHCSDQTFGHGGAQCAMGFCDPVNHLVVAWAANGFCGEGHHQRRNRAINHAVYEDLNLA